MTNNLQTQKKEVENVDGLERTRETRVYTPRVDIVSNGDTIKIWAEMPGVDEKNVDMTVEKNILTINGYTTPNLSAPEGYNLAYSEYGLGDYQRTFTLPDEIDRDGIEARIKDGILLVSLPKAPEAKAKKITVKAG